MSILIKGMEMPQPKFADMATVYDAYILVNPNGRAVIVVDDEDGLNSIEYTLVPVPPHGRLIDADAFEAFIRKDWDKNDHWIAEVVYSRPTIIQAEEGER